MCNIALRHKIKTENQKDDLYSNNSGECSNDNTLCNPLHELKDNNTNTYIHTRTSKHKKLRKICLYILSYIL